MTHYFEREKDAVILFLDLVRQKRSRGYSTLCIIAVSIVKGRSKGA